MIFLWFPQLGRDRPVAAQRLRDVCAMARKNSAESNAACALSLEFAQVGRRVRHLRGPHCSPRGRATTDAQEVMELDGAPQVNYRPVARHLARTSATPGARLSARVVTFRPGIVPPIAPRCSAISSARRMWLTWNTRRPSRRKEGDPVAIGTPTGQQKPLRARRRGPTALLLVLHGPGLC